MPFWLIWDLGAEWIRWLVGMKGLTLQVEMMLVPGNAFLVLISANWDELWLQNRCKGGCFVYWIWIWGHLVCKHEEKVVAVWKRVCHWEKKIGLMPWVEKVPALKGLEGNWYTCHVEKRYRVSEVWVGYWGLKLGFGNQLYLKDIIYTCYI